MGTKYTIFSISVIIAGSLAMASCQKVSELEGRRQLSFNVSTEKGTETVLSKSTIDVFNESGESVLQLISSEEPNVVSEETKAVQINGAREDLFYNNGFGIYGFNASGAKVIDGISVSLTDETGDVDAIGTPSTSYFWGEDTKMSFVGFYPKGETRFSNATAANAFSFSHTTPAKASEQVDLMLSYYSGKGVNGAASLNFTHPLTSVKFKVGNVESSLGKIKSITIKNVYTAGTCTATPDATNNTFKYSWTAEGTQNVTASGSGAITEGQTLGNDFTYIIIPQDLSSKPVVFQFTFEDGTICSTTVSSGEWKSGFTNLYTISTDGGYVYIVSQTDDIIADYQGSTNIVSISSYKTKDGGATKIPVSWSIKYKENGASNWSDTAPDWLSVDIASSSTVSTDVTFTSNLMPKILDSRAKKFADALKNKKSDSSWQSSESNRLDLSRGGETANCYVVNASGYFKIPLIYGNARKADGTTNERSFNPQGEWKNQFSDHLLNYRGHEITNMSIPDDDGGITLKDAILVWEDERGLVSNVKLNGNFLEFDIIDDDAMQGNALVAVRDNNEEIVWSWHIWVTDYVLGSENSRYQIDGYNYTYLGREIGWCDPKKISYGSAPRYCEIMVYQDCSNGQLMEFTYGQNNQIFETTFNCMMYQHGRKDPEHGVYEDPFTGELRAKQEFVDYPQYAYLLDNAKATLAESIKNPNVHYCLNGDGAGYWTKKSDSEAYDYQCLWDTRFKTIYDPSPVGYRVPAGDAFRGFIDTETQYCTYPDGYKLKDADGNFSLFFLAAGMIHWTLGVPSEKGSASHWGAGMYSTNPNERGSLGFVTYNNGASRMQQGWTSGPAGYPVKPIIGD